MTYQRVSINERERECVGLAGAPDIQHAATAAVVVQPLRESKRIQRNGARFQVPTPNSVDDNTLIYATQKSAERGAFWSQRNVFQMLGAAHLYLPEREHCSRVGRASSLERTRPHSQKRWSNEHKKATFSSTAQILGTTQIQLDSVY